MSSLSGELQTSWDFNQAERPGRRFVLTSFAAAGIELT
jgi:hypothetical protein